MKKRINYEQNRLKKEFKFEIFIDPNKKEKKEILNFFVLEKHKQLKRTGAWNYLNFNDFADHWR